MSTGCKPKTVPRTWLPIRMGGPLGPPAKRGDMKDWGEKKTKKGVSEKQID